MPSRSLDDLHPLLAQAYRAARDQFHQQFPNLPQPFVTCTYRSQAEQAALYAQGRQPLAEINRLRKLAGMLPTNATEGGRRVTNAQPGQSAHNFKPALAFDVAFITTDQKVDWNESLFQRFAPLVLSHRQTEWGGSWTGFKDTPHFQLQNWRNYIPLPRTRGGERPLAADLGVNEWEDFSQGLPDDAPDYDEFNR